MISKFAVPFWLCVTVGMVAGVATDHGWMGLIVGLMVGVVLGFAAVAAAKHKKQRAFRVPLAGVPRATPTPATPELPKAA